MAAPTYVQDVETDWTASTAASKTTASMNVQANDLLVAVMLAKSANLVTSLTASGGSLTWTQRVTQGTGAQALAVISTAVASSTTSLTVTVTRVGSTSTVYGATVFTIRGTQGPGATGGGANATSSAPSANLTTTGANSLIVVGNIDAAAGTGARTWRTGFGALTETTYTNTLAQATVYGGYHADSGAISTQAVGLTAPNQQWALAALEVLASAAAGRTTKNIRSMGLGMQHGVGFQLPASGRYLG